jgi:hypothetical protein
MRPPTLAASSSRFYLVEARGFDGVRIQDSNLQALAELIWKTAQSRVDDSHSQFIFPANEATFTQTRCIIAADKA